MVTSTYMAALGYDSMTAIWIHWGIPTFYVLADTCMFICGIIMTLLRSCLYDRHFQKLDELQGFEIKYRVILRSLDGLMRASTGLERMLSNVKAGPATRSLPSDQTDSGGLHGVLSLSHVVF